MTILLFMLTAWSLIMITTTAKLKKEGKTESRIILSLIGGIIITVIGTSDTCQDGWLSENIGIQGACSSHGGVITSLNPLGWGALVISIIVIIKFIQKPSKERSNQ